MFATKPIAVKVIAITLRITQLHGVSLPFIEFRPSFFTKFTQRDRSFALAVADGTDTDVHQINRRVRNSGAYRTSAGRSEQADGRPRSCGTPGGRYGSGRDDPPGAGRGLSRHADPVGLRLRR